MLATGSLYYDDGWVTLQLWCCLSVLLLSAWSRANTYSVMSYGWSFFVLLYCLIVPVI